MNNTQEKHILIIGGVAGGASAAARARRLSETAKITLIERGPDVSFANCGLPYHIGGEITDRSRLALQTPESLRSLLAIDVKNLTEATSIDRDKKEVTVRSMNNGTEEVISYDTLILAPGASPLVPPLEGIKDDKIITLRNLQDMDKIKVAAETADSVLVIGAGFIGLEMAEQLRHIGKNVHVVELQQEVLPQVDPEIAAPITKQMREHSIDVVLGDGVSGFTREGELITAKLNSGKTITTGLVILSIGVRPESDLAKACGLELSARGHIVVNEFQQTSDPDIYAAGDVCETVEPILGGRVSIPLGGPANRQGRTAADHIFLGEKALPYPGSIGTSIVRVFDQVVATTGYNERRLQMEGVDYDTVTINAHKHAGYYPGATNVTLKILWRKSDGRVLGASAVGPDGIDKRMDVMATAITGKLTIDDLTHIELSYSPPFGSAKDPVNLAAMAACNLRDGLVTPVEMPLPDDVQLIDVRPQEMVSVRPIPGAKSIPVSELRGRLSEIDKSRPVVTVCALGKLSYFASRILKLNGYDVRSITGGVTSNPSIAPVNPTPIPVVAPSSATETPSAQSIPENTHKLDCTGLPCPGPIVNIKEKSTQLAPGDVLEVSASDAGFATDFPAFCTANGYEFLNIRREKGIVYGSLRIPTEGEVATTSSESTCTSVKPNNDATLVIFSQEMDKVLAGLVIANGALAMGGQVTLFFTFWGLNALRKPGSAPVDGKNMMDKMFGMMLPQGTDKLPLSNMNMGGMGTRMMKSRMAAKNLPNLEGLLNDVIKGGAKLVACSMSMDAMGIQHEELLDGVSVGGVAEFLGDSSKSGTTLFI